jgi:hypothetical protein
MCEAPDLGGATAETAAWGLSPFSHPHCIKGSDPLMQLGCKKGLSLVEGCAAREG